MLALILLALMSTNNDDTYLIGYNKGRPFIFEADRIPGLDINNNHLFLRRDAAEAWHAMILAAKEDGIDLTPTYAYRDHRTQKRLKKKLPKLAAKSGFSPHEAGIAVDISGTIKRIKNKRYKTNIYRWLQQHAHKYGFYQTIPKESWHWEYKCEQDRI